MENNLYISRFWTRIWAILIDSAILGVFGFILGLFFKEFFVSLGDSAVIIGWVISLTYFTIMNSKINGGQTFGKSIMNIQVTDIDGNAIGLKTSFLRAFILTLPLFLNGLNITGSSLFSVVTILQSVIVFTFGFGIIIFYIFNKQNRQSIHDIIAKTYVVEDYRNEEKTLMPRFGKLPLYILSGIFVLIVSFNIFNLNSDSEIARLVPIYDAILEQENISAANIHFNSTPIKDSMGKAFFVYTINIKLRKSKSLMGDKDDTKDMPEIRHTVETFINNKAYKTDNDILNVVVNSGYDIGIFKQNNSYNIFKPIYAWKAAIEERNSVKEGDKNGG